MRTRTEDAALIRNALAYAVEIYREITEENGAPSLGTQNQTVDFILADPVLSAAVTEWGNRERIGEATMAAARRLRYDETYRRVKAFMLGILGPPIFSRKDRG